MAVLETSFQHINFSDKVLPTYPLVAILASSDVAKTMHDKMKSFPSTLNTHQFVQGESRRREAVESHTYLCRYEKLVCRETGQRELGIMWCHN